MKEAESLPKHAEKLLLAQIKKSNLKLSDLSLQILINQMVEFYQNTRFQDVDMSADGDMLLFQWGTYDWGEGTFFEFDITRQLIESSKTDDDAISQLHATMYFPESAGLSEVSGNRWFDDLASMADIPGFINGLPFMNMLQQMKPTKIDIRSEYV